MSAFKFYSIAWVIIHVFMGLFFVAIFLGLDEGTREFAWKDLLSSLPIMGIIEFIVIGLPISFKVLISYSEKTK